MEYVTYAISIILAIWLYLLLNKRRREQLSCYLGLDIQFTLKRWWALWCISKEKKMERDKDVNKEDEAMIKMKSILKPCPDNTKIIIDETSCDSVFFYGADQTGNSLLVEMNHRAYHMMELKLQLILSDGRVYVLPDYPNTTTIESMGQKWSASGLKIELLEPRKRWRIVYNGLLRNQRRGDVSNDDNVEHIRLNCIFIGNSRTLEWPNDWSTRLHADALAHEPWRSPDWMHKIKLINYSGFDQWGSIIGQITFKNSNPNALYLRGLCQRRWGKHESHQFHRTVTFLGVTTHGAMYCIGVSKTTNSFSHMQFGHLKDNRGKVSAIDWTDLRLNGFEEGNIVLLNYKIAFTAAGREYKAHINYTVGDATTCYNGLPWCWANTTRNLRVELNNSKGIGLMIMSHLYIGSSQDKTLCTKTLYLTRPDTFAQKDKHTLLFSDKQCQNENIVGGKGYSLAVLTSIATDDFIVPQGFCVTYLALEQQLRHHKELQDLIDTIVDISCCRKEENLESYCQKTVNIIQNTPVDEEIRKAILEDLDKLATSINDNDTCIRYAVRSSAVGEDSEDTSAAGQNSTFLGVSNADDVIKSVAKCWASLFSYQSVRYRQQNGLPIKASMGVCIQRMVNADAAGVMFTRHPTTGDPSSILITSNYGLGETVVSGTVEPDTLTIHKKWDNTLTMGTSVLGDKKQKILMNDNGTVTSNVSEKEINEISISDKIALRLAKVGLYLESIFGSARDVEWAVVGEEIFLLQARPITSINTWTDFELIHELDSGVPCDIDLITFANIEEVLPEPISPLSISSVINILNLSIGAKFHMYDSHYLHIVGMRCAINYFDSILRDVDNEITMMNKMIDMAICGRVVITPEIHKTALEKYGIISRWRKMYLLFDTLRLAWRNDTMMEIVADIFSKYALNADEFDVSHNLYDVISRKYEEIFQIGKYHNLASLVSVSYQMTAMSLLTKGSDTFTSEHLADIAILLGSCTNIISTEVPIVLGKIAASIRKSGKAEEFNKIEPAKAANWLKLNCPAAAEKLEAFFNMHGHRGVQELDLFSEPWILKPDHIITTIRTLATSLQENYVSKTLNVEETIASLKTPISSFKRFLLRKLAPFCRKAVTRREMTKSIIVHTVHILRLAYKRLGTLMVAEGYIPDKNLVFFLTHYEIGQILSNHNPLFVRKALRRKKIHQQIATYEYAEFNMSMPIPIQRTLNLQSNEPWNKIEGTSVCGGSVLGRACVITNLTEAKCIRHGDILITHCTDIGWSPYFPLLGGIVTELGGLISHGAVVAREYGLPCIIGAKTAVKVFQTGDIVLLAADIGVLQLIKKADN